MLQNVHFGKPVVDLVRQRVSCRSFDGRRPGAEFLGALVRFPAGLELPFKSRLRFGVIDMDRVRAENLFSAGSYGLIKGARHYLAALVRKEEPRCWEDNGFALEASVLFATSKGLGTCWIGGVFDRKRFGRVLGIGPGEHLPAVIAVGWPAPKPSLRERLVRWSARGDQRKSATELFFEGGWRSPLPVEHAGPWAQALECVRLGPSASNNQPWRIIRDGGAFHFFLDRDRAYSALVPSADLQRIDLGIAMCHFQLAAVESGLDGEWRDSKLRIEGTPAHYEYIVSYAIK
jgi:nitroreductase